MGAKFHEEVTNVKRLCIHMDISLEKKGKKTGATLKECYVIFIKSAVYVYRTTCSAVIWTFLGEGGAYRKGDYLIFLALGEALIRRGRLFEAGR